MPGFPLPLANAANYPKASVLATALSHQYKFGASNRSSYSQFFVKGVFTKNGRAAIANVALFLGLKAGDVILLPEYFCPAMVEPFMWLGLEVRFYRLQSNLSVDDKHFESLLDENVKACLFVRYFGFSLGIEKALLLAKKHGLLAIEDCAHSFFSRKATADSLTFDASICSLNKFFPNIDGGMYRLNSSQYSAKPLETPKRSYKEELKNLLQFTGVDALLSAVKGKLFPPVIINENKLAETETLIDNSTYRYFHPEDLKTCCFKLTEWLVRTSNYQKICAARVNNYQRLYQGLKNSSTGHPFIEFEESAVPYVFPFLLNNSDDFHYIRKQGIQILRWEEFYHTDNSDIESYRERLVQVPCHQNLTLQQIDQIISIINKDNHSYEQ